MYALLPKSGRALLGLHTTDLQPAPHIAKLEEALSFLAAVQVLAAFQPRGQTAAITPWQSLIQVLRIPHRVTALCISSWLIS